MSSRDSMTLLKKGDMNITEPMLLLNEENAPQAIQLPSGKVEFVEFHCDIGGSLDSNDSLIEEVRICVTSESIYFFRPPIWDSPDLFSQVYNLHEIIGVSLPFQLYTSPKGEKLGTRTGSLVFHMEDGDDLWMHCKDNDERALILESIYDAYNKLYGEDLNVDQIDFDGVLERGAKLRKIESLIKGTSISKMMSSLFVSMSFSSSPKKEVQVQKNDKEIISVKEAVRMRAMSSPSYSIHGKCSYSSNVFGIQSKTIKCGVCNCLINKDSISKHSYKCYIDSATGQETLPKAKNKIRLKRASMVMKGIKPNSEIIEEPSDDPDSVQRRMSLSIKGLDNPSHPSALNLAPLKITSSPKHKIHTLSIDSDSSVSSTSPTALSPSSITRVKKATSVARRAKSLALAKGDENKIREFTIELEKQEKILKKIKAIDDSKRVFIG